MSKFQISNFKFQFANSLVLGIWFLGFAAVAAAQPPNARIGEVVPRDVREMYDRGLQYLATTQSENGDWTGGGGEFGIDGFSGFGGRPELWSLQQSCAEGVPQHHHTAERDDRDSRR